MKDTLDARIYYTAVRYILKNTVGGGRELPWTFTSSTLVGALHASLVGQLLLGARELAIVSAFFSSGSWYAFTTRRIVSQFDGTLWSMNPAQGVVADFRNFKG